MPRRLRAVAPLTLLLACSAGPRPLRLATTTSVENSGLLAMLMPVFRAETAIDVHVIAVGSGKAIHLARNGDADVILTHDPPSEAIFLKEGGTRLYRKIMFNDFVIVGPEDDPAGVNGASDALEAMRRIAASSSPFASRGDASGTHAREQWLWTQAGSRPRSDGLLETGQGMAATLRIANERHAYTLTDRATLAQLASTMAMSVVFEGGNDLLNTYAVVVMRRKNQTREESAMRLAEWLSEGGGRRLIDEFTVAGVHPFSAWPPGAPRDSPEALPER